MANTPIKIRLQQYLVLQQRVANQQKRLHSIKADRLAPAPPKVSGMPRSSNVSDPVGKQQERVDQLERYIGELLSKEEKERVELERLVKRLGNPNEQLVIEMRYFDQQNWEGIFSALYERQEDYYENYDNYKQAGYRLHGAALRHLASITRGG